MLSLNPLRTDPRLLSPRRSLKRCTGPRRKMMKKRLSKMTRKSMKRMLQRNKKRRKRKGRRTLFTSTLLNSKRPVSSSPNGKNIERVTGGNNAQTLLSLLIPLFLPCLRNHCNLQMKKVTRKS